MAGSLRNASFLIRTRKLGNSFKTAISYSKPICKELSLKPGMDSVEAERRAERESWTEVCSILMSLSDLDGASREMRKT